MQAELGGRTVSLNQGKALGGSSAINCSSFVPPTKANMDAWETLGNEGWNWDVMHRYLTKVYSHPSVEHEDTKKKLGIDGWQAQNDTAKGLLFTSFPQPSVHGAWAKTLGALGQEMTRDPFLGATSGSFSNLYSIHPVTKERSYAASAYYGPAKGRKNLEVLTSAVVEKILFACDASGVPKATGVQLTINGESKTMTASKEVILAAGTLQSPKILELSGIGDAQLLQKHDIEVIKDLPGVGENLQDHLVSAISYQAVDTLETMDALARQEPEAIGAAMQEYATSKTGMLAGIGMDSYAYMPLQSHASTAGRDRLSKLIEENRPLGSHARAQEAYDLAAKTLLDPKAPSASFLTFRGQYPLPVDLSWSPNSPVGPVPGKFLTISPFLSQPLSRGTVHIRSPNPSDAPTIDPRYLSNPVDLDVLAEALLLADSLATSEPLSSTFLVQPLQRRDPASDFRGDLDKAKRFLRTSSMSMWHPVGTCAMLPLGKRGVVDSKLCVHGIRGLRVVDASVMPIITTANTQAVVYAVAERASDLIMSAWRAL